MSGSADETMRRRLAELPSVDELLRGESGTAWLSTYPRRLVVAAVRDAIDAARRLLVKNPARPFDAAGIAATVSTTLRERSRPPLRRVLNASGIIIHTNLGRAPLADDILDHIRDVAGGYSNLEFNLDTGGRGKRFALVRDILREITGAEDALVVNNNAAAVLLCLTALAAGRDVIVSRGELIEIGGAFRIPDVMAAGGARLREVGTTNKTHVRDYEEAITDETALLLKVHPSNYRIVGFSSEVPCADLVALGRRRGIPVMFDLGSGSIVDLSAYGIPGEPTVGSVVSAGTDIVTFSGDKLLGGPQGGVIVGRKHLIEQIQRHPLTRALRVDKLTLAGMEATFRRYRDEQVALRDIPVLAMLTASPESLRRRARRLAGRLRKTIAAAAEIRVIAEKSQAGGGSLPERELPTWAVALRPRARSTARLEEALRRGDPPVVARVRDDALLLDLRTLADRDMAGLCRALERAFRRDDVAH